MLHGGIWHSLLAKTGADLLWESAAPTTCSSSFKHTHRHDGRKKRAHASSSSPETTTDDDTCQAIQ